MRLKMYMYTLALSAFSFGTIMTTVPDIIELNTVIVPQKIDLLIDHKRKYQYSKLASILNTTPEIVELVINVAEEEGIDPLLFLALIWSESNFRVNAVSSKGYHGLSQIPWKIPYKDVNLIIGARIFKEKYRQTNDLYYAILYYKGYKKSSRKGRQQVAKVLRMYTFLKKYYQLMQS